jgi:hypothetical protein
MGTWMLRSALRLSPKSWRERYGAEILDLSHELVAAKETTWFRLVLGLLASGCIERFRPVVQRSRILLTSLLFVVAVVGVAAVSTNLFGSAVSTNIEAQSAAPVHAAGTITGSLDLHTLESFVEPGSVLFVGDGGNRTTVRVGTDGHFVLQLSPGRYSAVGKSPRVHSNGYEMRCASHLPVLVHSGDVTNVTVVCEGIEQRRVLGLFHSESEADGSFHGGIRPVRTCELQVLGGLERWLGQEAWGATTVRLRGVDQEGMTEVDVSG